MDDERTATPWANQDHDVLGDLRAAKAQGWETLAGRPFTNDEILDDLRAAGVLIFGQPYPGPPSEG